MQKLLEVLPNDPDDVATIPLCKVRVAGVGVILEVSTEKLTTALADFLILEHIQYFLLKKLYFLLKSHYQ